MSGQGEASTPERVVAARAIRFADAYGAFRGHGAGGSDPSASFVFGDDCDDANGAVAGFVTMVGGWFDHGDAGGVKRHFDPHPNNKGAPAIADAIVAVA